jgi:hypothetical protein
MKRKVKTTSTSTSTQPLSLPFIKRCERTHCINSNLRASQFSLRFVIMNRLFIRLSWVSTFTFICFFFPSWLIHKRPKQLVKRFCLLPDLDGYYYHNYLGFDLVTLLLFWQLKVREKMRHFISNKTLMFEKSLKNTILFFAR